MANPEHLAVLKQGIEVWNQWRRENPETVPDFRGAILNEVDLARFHLWDSDLSGAFLMEADLTEAILYRANLSRANLSNARLVKAGLQQADLSGAILNSADLNGSHLPGAILRGSGLGEANLADSWCWETSFTLLDLSTTVGLESIVHIGPSTVGIDTLIKSKGRIPEVFLRGCGVPSELIESISRIFAESRIRYHSCFISYSHADKSFAQRVYDTLYNLGVTCWLDDENMKIGDEIFGAVHKGIRESGKVVLCISRSSLTSSWVDRELNILFAKEEDLSKKHGQKEVALIPVDLDGFLYSDECQNPKAVEIRSRRVANFQGWENDNALFDREMEKVIKALRTDAGRESPPPQKL
ncbi:MAG: toll/interleukin-1 receptor domain-containing protein [Anaerolineae bacterium]|nr:toll/interleukin-1 receptor domain-containing protein [Anaerolineae bacterium]